MEQSLLQRLDAFPYRHTVGELMHQPLFTLPPATPLGVAITEMAKRKVSSTVVCNEHGSVLGIVTEHDVLKHIGAQGAAALQASLHSLMSQPVASVPASALLFVALGRMDRLQVRHLLVTGPLGEPVGMLTARAVLKQRASAALRLGDEIMGAADAKAMRRVHDALPSLARDLLAEGATAGEVAGVISSVNCDLSARAAELAALSLTPRLGPAPAPWCFLVLGSGGRGESLLAPDQDNALVFDGDHDTCDPWFQALGERAAELLNEAGIPFCRGGVMASKPLWRGSLERWRHRISHWRDHPEPEALLAIDIFFDFVAVAGELRLGAQLRALAQEVLVDHTLPRLMAQQLQVPPSPFTLLGALRGEEGRLDLKKQGLYPVVLGARVLALAKGLSVPSTPVRLQAAQGAGLLNEEDAQGLIEAFRFFQAQILAQQLDDIAAGLSPSAKVSISRFGPRAKRQLRDASQRIGLLKDTVESALRGP